MKFKVKFLDIGTSDPIVLMDPLDLSKLGMKENDRAYIEGKKTIVAMVQVSDSLVKPQELVLIGSANKLLGAEEGDEVEVSFCSTPESVRSLRKKMDGEKLTTIEINSIVDDIADNKLSKMEIAAWVTALHINGMDLEEIADLARAMLNTGDIVNFTRSPVFDFHSMGGVPGNKITPIVVSIVAAAGLMLPKTSSRAISSACGTSDFVETFCNVELDAKTLRSIGEEVGGVFAWGGSMNLAPVDDIVIKVEHALGINPRAKMLASILSKKMAIGATHLLMDIPMGAGTKVPDVETARSYASDFMNLGELLDIHIECAITYAEQPVGSAIGPKLEARECIRILEGDNHPASVIEKSCEMAGIILEMGGITNGFSKAKELLESGAALTKFKEIVRAQGGNYDIKSDDLVPGEFSVDIISPKAGYVHAIKNKDIVYIAKAAGAPADKGAGLLLHFKKGQRIEVGDVLFTIYADNKAKLDRARELAIKYHPYEIEGMLLKRVSAVKVRPE